MSDDNESEGATRRQVLAGAAGAATLPAWATAGSAAASDEEQSPDEQHDYGRSTVLKTSGTLEVWSDSNNETKVQVSSHPEGIGLRLMNGFGSMNILLLPEDIEPLCRELLAASAKTKPEDVEDAREWITADFREGDA